jgi:hypothetical protein
MSETEIKISQYDLSKSEADLLSTYSLGLMTLKQFSGIRLLPDPWEENFAGNALGIRQLAKELPAYDIACSAFNLRHCQDFSTVYKVPSESDTGIPYIEAEMDVLTTALLPIVFFVPPKLRTYRDPVYPEKRPYYALREMEWALRHPKRINNMMFVFGLYEHIEQHEPYLPDNLLACGQYLINSLSADFLPYA